MTEPESDMHPKFTGGDRAYLRDQQYASSDRLAARANLHVRYATAPVPWFAWVHSHLGLRPGADVLECGCGAGWLWAEPGVEIPRSVRLTVTDLSPGMVAEAIGRLRAVALYEPATGLQVDLMSLPFDDASFDVVIADHMLYHLPDPEVGVAELARVVRPGGRVVAATNGSGHLRELVEIGVEVFGWNGVDRAAEAFGAETGFPVLRRHFASVRWEQYPDRLRCTDPTDVIAYLTSFPPGEDADDRQLARLDAAVRTRFALGGGELEIGKDTGLFVCERPRR